MESATLTALACRNSATLLEDRSIQPSTWQRIVCFLFRERPSCFAQETGVIDRARHQCAQPIIRAPSAAVCSTYRSAGFAGL